MDVRVKDAEYKNPMATVGDLSWDLRVRLGPFFRSFTPEQKEYAKKNSVSELITADGDSYFNNSGILNVYLSPIHPDLRNKFKEAILYFLKDAGVEYGVPYVNKSNWNKDIDTFRVPIKSMPEVKDRPPELNLANANAHHLFHTVLGFPGDDSGFEVSARDLLMKINMYNNELADMDARLTTTGTGSGGANFISFGLSGDQIRERLDKIAAIAKWAIDNNYDTIQVY